MPISESLAMIELSSHSSGDGKSDSGPKNGWLDGAWTYEMSGLTRSQFLGEFDC